MRRRSKKNQKKRQDFRTPKAKPQKIRLFLAESIPEPVFRLRRRQKLYDQINYRDKKPVKAIQKPIVTVQPDNQERRNLRISQQKIQTQRMAICKKRKDRRAALFALQKAGSGVKGPKIKKLDANSTVRC
jgi:hypothetical protein